MRKKHDPPSVTAVPMRAPIAQLGNGAIEARASYVGANQGGTNYGAASYGGSNHGGLRAFNERVLLQAVRHRGSLPKAELARLTGLTAQSIGLIAARLEDDGLLKREASVRGRVGQPSVPLALDPEGAYFIGVHVGRRVTDILLVDFVGAVRARESLPYAFPEANVLLPAIGEGIRRLHAGLGKQATRLAGVGAAAPLFFGGWHKLLGVPDVQASAWNQLDLGQALQAMSPVPVRFAKDTAAACIAELTLGHGRTIGDFLYLFIDTFVGGGVVVDGRIRFGVRGNAGAVASLPTGLASKSAVRPSANGRGARPDQLVQHASLWELERRLSAAKLDPMAAYDARALEKPYRAATQAWVAQAAPALAQCIVAGAAFLDVHAIILDGSFVRPLLDWLLAETREAVARYNREGMWDTPVLAGTIGADARALGGALLPLNATFSPDREAFLKVA